MLIENNMPARCCGRTFVPFLYAETPLCIERPFVSKVFPVKCASAAFSMRKRGIFDAKVRHLRCESTAFSMRKYGIYDAKVQFGVFRESFYVIKGKGSCCITPQVPLLGRYLTAGSVRVQFSMRVRSFRSVFR